MKQSRALFAMIAIFCVVAAVLFVAGSKRAVSPDPDDIPRPQELSLDPSIKTRASVDPSVVAPATDSQVPQNVARPLSVSPLMRNSKYKLRAFRISIAENKFSPDTVIVEIGDAVRIDFAAVDRDYDVYQPEYGFNRMVEKGETESVEFRADATGAYTFFCVRCGGPSQGPRGYLMVTERK